MACSFIIARYWQGRAGIEQLLPCFALILDKFHLHDAGVFRKGGTIMLSNWKDRIDGIKRIVLALGVMCLCIMASLQHQEQLAANNPSTVRTANAGYGSCSETMRRSKMGLIGCAFVQNAKVKVSSIRFLSSSNNDKDARSKIRPFVQAADKR